MNVFRHQIRKIIEYFRRAHPCRAVGERIVDRDAHAANARASAALVGVDGDAVEVIHAFSIAEAETKDPIIAEIRNFRDKYARKHGFSVRGVAEDLKKYRIPKSIQPVKHSGPARRVAR